MSSLFVANPCPFDGDTIANFMAWSRSDPICAIATTTIVEDEKREKQQIHFMNNEGSLLADAMIPHRSAASAIDWQPNGRVLAIGCEDGTVSCWICDGRNRPTSVFSNSMQHSTTVTIVKWNPQGKRVLTGDKKGLVCVWAVDNRGALTPIRQYRKKGEILSTVFCVIPLRGSLVQAPRKQNMELKQTHSPAFFFGTDKGTLVYADDLGHCTDVQQLSSPIDILLFFDERSRLVVITRSLVLTQYQVAEDGKVSRVMQMKLSIASDIGTRGLKYVEWACPGLLVVASHEKMLRILDLATDESYNLSLNQLGEVVDRADRVIAVAFSPLDRYVAIGTGGGVIGIWKYNGPIRDVTGSRASLASTSSSDWELQFRTSVRSTVLQLRWSGGRGVLSAITEDAVIVLTEVVMCGGKRGDLVAIQVSNSRLSVQMGTEAVTKVVDAGILVKGLSVGRASFVVWNGEQARVYRVDSSLKRVEVMREFASAAHCMAVMDAGGDVAEEAVFAADRGNGTTSGLLRVLNYAGTQKGSINFTETEGYPDFVDINGNFLAVITNKGVVKVFDVKNPTKPVIRGKAGKFTDPDSGLGINSDPNVAAAAASLREQQQSSQSKKDDEASEGKAVATLAVRAIKVNSDGTKVAILTDFVEGSLRVRHNDTRLHVYDCNKGSGLFYEFGKDPRKCPQAIAWDDEDDRLMCCETLRIKERAPASTATYAGGPGVKGPPVAGGGGASKGDSEGSANEAETEVFMIFVTTEHGLLLQDAFSRRPPLGQLLSLTVPHIFFRSASVNDGNSDDGSSALKPVKAISRTMRDFAGMDGAKSNPEIKAALLDFSFFLTLGKLDEAYRCIKSIDNPSVWENMVQMCVKTKRLDVAEVCLANMGHARGAAAVRLSRLEGSPEVSAGVLAMQLGFNAEAAKSYREAKRFDLLNNLYQSAGLWEKAIQVATEHDRMHLKTTHYNYAKYLESVGEIEAAVEHYEFSDTARTEVPRMLFDNGRLEDLEDYVHKSDDAALLKWWAAYLESTKRFDKAFKYYRRAGDYLSLVRIACFQEDFARAAEIVNECGDKAGAYHFARQLELQGDYEGAINYFAEAGCFNHSIRLARAYGLDAELMKFALQSTSSLMLDCAMHFEDKEDYEKAVLLFHKGGDLPKALDLCFRAGEKNPAKSKGLYDMLNTIAQDLGTETSPQTLARCAEFLVTHKQFEKAVELYIMAKKYPQAIEMCLQSKVKISDDLAEKLTPEESVEPTERKDLLKTLARALKKQGSFALASKKYTLAGDRVKAIQCLVRSGDTKAVMQFATISRNAEIYTLAANYLQQMNWRESVEIMKAIIVFYTKAKAFEQLASFYDSCAQVEIDDYRDYEKAISALNEALKYLSKAGTSRAQEMTEMIEKRVHLIQRFVSARALQKKDPDAMVSICEDLLKEPLLEDAIRSGDCFALIVEHYHDRGKMKEAYHCLQDMESRNIPLAPYVETDILNAVYKFVGAGSGGRGGAARFGGSDSKAADDDNSPAPVSARKGSGEDGDFASGHAGFGSKLGGGIKGRGFGGNSNNEDEEEVEEEVEEVPDEDDDDRRGHVHGYKRK